MLRQITLAASTALLASAEGKHTHMHTKKPALSRDQPWCIGEHGCMHTNKAVQYKTARILSSGITEAVRMAKKATLLGLALNFSGQRDKLSDAFSFTALLLAVGTLSKLRELQLESSETPCPRANKFATIPAHVRACLALSCTSAVLIISYSRWCCCCLQVRQVSHWITTTTPTFYEPLKSPAAFKMLPDPAFVVTPSCTAWLC